ncbi:methylated-DNA--[protein]-cysteine S-methyltransferase [Clostridium chromiireducens]|uniref:Methylated-DNA--protein-cysteine methyltransferase n=1 Tax=Clostridium chromiireducens TaxID=225345 RepID=A0A964W3I6_9CLOT|nr:methylated-DNA--[protein]-cysteine S-methyltransferase [Clostridium chromiireducens]MVX65586.1 methylated-DNA--[protein]-cysteine S-methyltransferase [Clostridium chromiireducens]
MKNVFYYNTKIGKMGIEENGAAITRVFFLTKESQREVAKKEETILLKEAIKEINEYLDGKRNSFDLPLSPEGTEFQKKVWDALKEIPCGETRSYGEIAKIIGNEKASRAVGMANNKNPIMLIIPCHRVIGANGKLVGYAGGLDIKEKLLNLEKNYENSKNKIF